MRPVKDRWTGPARTPPVSARPPRRTWRGQAWNTPTRVPPRGVAGLRRTGLGDQSGGGTGLLGGAPTGTQCRTILLANGNLAPRSRTHRQSASSTHHHLPQLRRVRWPETAGRTEHVRRRSPHSQASVRLVPGHARREGWSGLWPAITHRPSLCRFTPRLRSIDWGRPPPKATGREAPRPRH